MEEKIKAAFEKEGFADKLAACETPEEAQKLFASEGIKLSLDEVKALGSALEKKLEGGEISDDELDSVAGGVSGKAVMAGAEIAYEAYKHRNEIKHFGRKIFSRW